jgi:hypothetical protein
MVMIYDGEKPKKRGKNCFMQVEPETKYVRLFSTPLATARGGYKQLFPWPDHLVILCLSHI